MPRDEERERLITHICEQVRLVAPARKWTEYLNLRTRIQKSSLAVLRQIADLDLVNATARELGVIR
jgi:hypothetical protein